MAEFKQLLGFDKSCLLQVDGAYLHRDCVPCWEALRATSAEAGFDLAIASAYRGFDRQLCIWNEKARGQRPVFDADEQPLDIHALSGKELVFAILRWSALPGASRHHWGSELDIYERSLLPEGYELQLTVEEALSGGVLGSFYRWFNEQFSGGEFCGFARPYFQNAASAVANEPWHLSCVSVAKRYEVIMEKAALKAFYQSREDIALKDDILASFDEIYARYILV